MNTTSIRPLAIVTGASSGIGFHLAHQCADHGYDLVVAADRDLEVSIASLEAKGARVDAVNIDLSSEEGVDEVLHAVQGRPVEVLLANAGHGLGGGFLDQDWDGIGGVVGTNIVGTIYLVHQVGRRMRARGSGRILLTGSIAGFIPGSFQAVYNGTKAFIDSFSWALRNELKDSGVTVTCLMPGATDTDFFARAGMLDTKVGQGKKDNPADVAKVGFEALLRGEGDIVSGMKNKVEAGLANITPAAILAEQHRRQAEPGSAH